jgi:hypothetical protein
MPNLIRHRRVNIITLGLGEPMTGDWHSGDIIVVQREDGWWTQFVGEHGELEGYDTPFESYEKALWTAKAAAEFSSE